MYYPIASGNHINGQILYEIPGSAQLHIGDSWSKLNQRVVMVMGQIELIMLTVMNGVSPYLHGCSF